MLVMVSMSDTTTSTYMPFMMRQHDHPPAGHDKPIATGWRGSRRATEYMLRNVTPPQLD